MLMMFVKIFYSRSLLWKYSPYSCVVQANCSVIITLAFSPTSVSKNCFSCTSWCLTSPTLVVMLIHALCRCPQLPSSNWLQVSARVFVGMGVCVYRGANPSVLGGRSSALRNFSRSSVRSQNLPLTKTQNLPLVLSVSKLSRDRLVHWEQYRERKKEGLSQAML